MLSTLLGSDGSRLSEGELERLALLIENARKKGRK
jgi:hypothetical protein